MSSSSLIIANQKRLRSLERDLALVKNQLDAHLSCIAIETKAITTFAKDMDFFMTMVHLMILRLVFSSSVLTMLLHSSRLRLIVNILVIKKLNATEKQSQRTNLRFTSVIFLLQVLPPNS
jgi:hypothetical protein